MGELFPINIGVICNVCYSLFLYVVDVGAHLISAVHLLVFQLLHPCRYRVFAAMYSATSRKSNGYVLRYWRCRCSRQEPTH